MVGVPGRSRACLTCKKRRIACDQKHPRCGQCQRSDRECMFAGGLIFVHNEEGSHKTKYRKSDAVVSSASSDSSSSRTTSAAHPTPPLPVSRPVSTLTALRMQLLGEAHDQLALEYRKQLGASPWTYALEAFAGSVHALQSAPLSCYTVWTGRRTRNPYLVEASRRLYIQGLSEVQAAINNPSTALLDETLGACLSLIIYEVLECPDRARLGFYCHSAGCARIVKLRGAKAHQEGAAHDLFRAFRYIHLLNDTERHTPSFLSTPTWTTIPWQVRPKNTFDRLLDILALAPESLRKGDELSKLPPQDFLPALLELAEDVNLAQSKLQEIHSSLVDDLTEPPYWVQAPRLLNVEEDSSVESTNEHQEQGALHFKDLDTARMLTLYWSLEALSASGLTDMSAALAGLLGSNLIPGELVPVVQRLAILPQDWLRPVRNVIRSVEYCSLDSSEGIGPLLLAAPLFTVIDIMHGRQGCEPEMLKAVEVAKSISATWVHVNQFRETMASS